MLELIFLAIFIVSLAGILLILYRKIPVLVELPKNGSHGIPKIKFISEIGDKTKNIHTLFSKQIILHKFLSWVKVMTLKTETKIDAYLHKIRKKAQKIDRELKDKK